MKAVLTLDAGGFVTAADLLSDANQRTLAIYDTLTGSLSRCAGMAGSDATAADFHLAYDDAAQQSADTVVDLVGAWAGLGLAVRATLANHERAEAASAGGRSGEPDPGSHPFHRVLSVALPSSDGGDSASLPDWATWVLDHVGGFVWPDADTTRLREAGAAWTTAADGLVAMLDLVACAISSLEEQRSPEIPLMTEALAHARSVADRLVDQLLGLASACTGYADQVDAHRQMVLDLVSDLIRDTAIMEAAGALLDVVSLGGGTAAATAAAVEYIGTRAPELLRILEALRDAARAFAETLRMLRANVVDYAVDLKRYLVFQRDAFLVRGATRWELERSLLRFHEADDALGAHTVAMHVGHTYDWLLHRAITSRKTNYASSFLDMGTADRAVRDVLRGHIDDIVRYLRDPGDRWLSLDGEAGQTIGRIVHKSGTMIGTRSLRVRLMADPTMPGGFRIMTCFPIR